MADPSAAASVCTRSAKTGSVSYGLSVVPGVPRLVCKVSGPPVSTWRQSNTSSASSRVDGGHDKLAVFRRRLQRRRTAALVGQHQPAGLVQHDRAIVAVGRERRKRGNSRRRRRPACTRRVAPSGWLAWLAPRRSRLGSRPAGWRAAPARRRTGCRRCRSPDLSTASALASRAPSGPMNTSSAAVCERGGIARSGFPSGGFR